MRARRELTRRLTQQLRAEGNTARDIARLCSVSRITADAWAQGQGANARHLVRLAELTNTNLPRAFTALTKA